MGKRNWNHKGVYLGGDGWLPAFKRRALKKFARCQYCLAALTYQTATADHVVPVARGGGDGLENVALACRSCNTRKNDSVDVRPRHGPGNWAEILT